MKKPRPFILIFFGAALALILSLGLDRVTGFYLERSGFFKAMIPQTTEIYDTREYYAVATISAQGLRNPNLVRPKTKEAYRILAVGDSFTFGMGVDLPESWPKLLEQSLALTGKKIEVVNAGMPGASLDDDTKICQAYINYLDPDALLVGMYMDEFYQSWELTGFPSSLVLRLWPTFRRLGAPIIGDTRWPGGKPGDVVRSRVAWKKLVEINLAKAPGALLQLDPSLREDFLSGKILPALVGFALVEPDYYTYILNDQKRHEAIRAVGRDLSRLHACAGSRPAYLVFLPSEETVSADYLAYKKQLGYEIDSRLPKIDLDTDLGQLVEQAGFIYFSLLSEFRRDGCPGCYFPYDGHFTVKGHSRVAAYLSPRLTSKIRDK